MNDTVSLAQFMRGIKALNVPRAEDLPYWSSPPIQFVYESTAPLVLGTYTWNDAPGLFTPNRPIIDNALYFFRNITLGADIAELDYLANTVNTPEFYAFLESDSRAVLFREPILMNQYYQQFDYRYWWQRYRTDNILYGAFRGSMIQGPGLIGKNTITLRAIISAQEVVDESYIDLFKSQYPAPPKEAREAHEQ